LLFQPTRSACQLVEEQESCRGVEDRFVQLSAVDTQKPIELKAPDTSI
jgi:hypothetical protein